MTTFGAGLGATRAPGLACPARGEARARSSNGRRPDMARVERRYGFSLCSSTRRFCARPAAIALVATGLDGPYPCATIRDGATPLRARYARTAAARADDSR